MPWFSQGLVSVLYDGRETILGCQWLWLFVRLTVLPLHVAQLEQQLADQPAPVLVQTPLDPKAVEALNAVLELAKALKLIGGTVVA